MARRLTSLRARRSGLGGERGGELWSFRVSSIAWAGLAALAMVYLAGLAGVFGPEAGHEPETKTVTDRLVPRRDSPARAVPSAAADSNDSTLRAGLVKLTGEMRGLRSAIRDLRQRNDALERRLASLESAIGPATAALPTRPNRARAGSQPVTVALRPMPTDGFGDSSLSASPIPIAAAKAPSRTLFGAELATGATADALRVQWQGLRARHASLLAGLESRQAPPVPGTPATDNSRLRLLVGPFRNAADAARLCARLRAARASCKETVFTGELL